MERREVARTLIIGIIGVELGPFIGLLAWFAWKGKPVSGLAHIAGLFLF